jgi:O-antigen/teichoic acid export membrane protein
MSRIAKSLIIKGLLSLGALTPAIAFTGSITVGSCAILFAWLTVFVFYDRRFTSIYPSQKNRPDWNRPALLRLSVLWLPLGVTMMLMSLNANIPRYFLEHYQGPQSLGVFSALAAVQTAGALVVMAIGNSAAPRMARYYKTGAWTRFRKLTNQLLAACAGLGLTAVLVIAVAGDTLIRFVFGKEYAGQNATFLWIAIAAAISYCNSVLGYAATASNRIRFQPWVFVLVTLVTTVGCYAVVPSYGGRGAAMVMCAAASVGCAFYLWSFLVSAPRRDASADRPLALPEHEVSIG